MSHMPTLRQLRYFVALVRHRHFGRAAAQCHVSQSAFSIAIRELEAQLELSLVDRTSKQVTITAVGQEVAVLARHTLADAEELMEFAQRERSPPAMRGGHACKRRFLALSAWRGANAPTKPRRGACREIRTLVDRFLSYAAETSARTRRWGSPLE